MAMHDFLGTELPVIQAPMAGVQRHELAVAVSNAGGLGSLPCALLSPEEARDELRALTGATSKPFNLNFFCHEQPPHDPVREEAWRSALSPYYAEFGIDGGALPAAPGRAAFDWKMAEIVEEVRPPIASFHFGLPPLELLARVKATGAVVLSSATTVEEAVWLEERGVDAVIAQGLEAGGHRAQFLSDDLTRQAGTFALIPQVVRAVRVPVIAAGGIADARGVAAALRLGASAVQLGTAYLLCEEATTSAVHRATLASDAARHTAITNVLTGRPARAIVNRVMRELGPMSEVAPAFPLAAAGLAPLRAKAENKGSGDFSPMWAGQNVSGCRQVGAAELTRELAREL